MKTTDVIGCLAGVLLTAGAISEAAQAAERHGPRAVRVSYADLNLNSERGARLMISRLEQAVDKVCAQGDRWLMFRAEEAACRREAMAEAVRELNSPLVAALHTGVTAPVSLASR